MVFGQTDNEERLVQSDNAEGVGQSDMVIWQAQATGSGLRPHLDEGMVPSLPGLLTAAVPELGIQHNAELAMVV